MYIYKNYIFSKLKNLNESIKKLVDEKLELADNLEESLKAEKK